MQGLLPEFCWYSKGMYQKSVLRLSIVFGSVSDVLGELLKAILGKKIPLEILEGLHKGVLAGISAAISREIPIK